MLKGKFTIGTKTTIAILSAVLVSSCSASHLNRAAEIAGKMAEGISKNTQRVSYTSSGWYAELYSGAPIAGPFTLLTTCQATARYLSAKDAQVSLICNFKR